MDPNNWAIEIDKAQFDKLKTQERFWQLLALARAVNTLRFVQVALHAQPEGSESLQATRTKLNSFFFTCALLYEAFLLVQRLPKHFRDNDAFKPLQELLKDPIATELRNANLNPLRNTLTFHFSEDAIGAQLMKNDLKARFVKGEGTSNADTYYEMADLCTLGAFSGIQLNQSDATEQFAKQANNVTDLAIRFYRAAETFIVAVLQEDGWEGR